MLMIINEISQDISNPLILKKSSYTQNTPLKKVFCRRNNFILELYLCNHYDASVLAIIFYIFDR